MMVSLNCKTDGVGYLYFWFMDFIAKEMMYESDPL